MDYIQKTVPLRLFCPLSPATTLLSSTTKPVTQSRTSTKPVTQSTAYTKSVPQSTAYSG